MCFKISLLSLAVEDATIYGILYTLPNIIEQIKITNLSANAAKAMELLNGLNRLLCKFFKENNGAKKIELKLSACSKFEQFKEALELLSHDKKIKDKFPWIDDLIKILKQDSDPEANQAWINFFEKTMGPEFRSKNEFISKELNDLKSRLSEIHLEPYQNTGIVNFLKNNKYFFFIYIVSIILKLYIPWF